MPHLAPFKWLFLAITFWTMLLLSFTMTWWQTVPQMPLFSSSFISPSTPKWPWL